MLSHLLLSAGGFAVVRSELHAMNVVGPRYGGLRKESDREALIEAWVRTEVHRRTGISDERLGELVRGGVRSAADFLGVVMGAVCEAQGARRWSDCTPENAAHVEELARAFPQARFLHVVRDGRDVAVSMAKKGMAHAMARDAGREVEVAAVLWEWFVQRAREGCAALGERALEVRYEELVGDRAGVLARVEEFLDHRIDVARVEEVGLGSVSRPNTSFEEDLEGGEFQPVERWRSLLDAEELARVEGLVGETLLELGYELALRREDAVEDDGLKGRYQRSIAVRQWLKRHTPLGRKTDDSALGDFGPLDEGDPSLRPSENLEFVRGVVAGGVSGG